MAKKPKKSALAVMDPKIISDLRASSYNPRSITDRQLDAMVTSYFKFGDLSGIVFNRRTGNLVGGHQRTTIFKKHGKKSAIVKKPYSDKYGTITVGYVDVTVKKDGHSSVIRIPYREVKWDADTEKAANIAANAAGGDFDLVKLGKVLKELEDRKFSIEDVPIDPWMHRKSIAMFESNKRRAAEGVDQDGEFAVISPEAVEASLEHCCPRCGHRWSGSTKVSKASAGGGRTRAKGPAKRVSVDKEAKVLDKKGKVKKTKSQAKPDPKRKPKKGKK